MKLLTIAVLLLTTAPPAAPREAPGPAPKASSRQRAPAFKDFEARFRTAVLKKDVDWILANMDPTGWVCGDAEMPAAEYAKAFREGEMDYSLLFGPIDVPMTSSASNGTLTYQEWFARCPDATVEETLDSDFPGVDRLYAVRWRGAGCPEGAPGFLVAVHGTRLGIRVFSGCM